MYDTDQIHELFRKYDSFTILLEDLNSEQRRYELGSAIQATGKEIDQSLPDDFLHLSDHDLGWIRLLWEAHHQEAEKATAGGVH